MRSIVSKGGLAAQPLVFRDLNAMEIPKHLTIG
jgi:hypothetical protein